MYTVKQVSEITGVSVKTLHHYHALGLLLPGRVSQAGYRLYGPKELERLRSILLFRELRFSLKEIREILDSPYFDPRSALTEQLALLEQQRDRLEELIGFARRLLDGEEKELNFTVFDQKKQAQYRAEAKERWGHTDAWKEYEAKDNSEVGADPLMALFAEFGAIRQEGPDSSAAQAKVRELQDCITAHYYTCTREILSGLGQMYTADPRFAETIDRAGGEGTAEFVSAAIRHYCGA